MCVASRVVALQVYAAVRSVRSVVARCWLNIPAGGRYCQRYGEPQTQVALQLLGRLEFRLFVRYVQGKQT